MINKAPKRTRNSLEYFIQICTSDTAGFKSRTKSCRSSIFYTFVTVTKVEESYCLCICAFTVSAMAVFLQPEPVKRK